MQPPRPFRGYDKDMFTFLPTSNRDALDETPRKRKLNAYDRQIPMSAPSRSGRSGPKSYTGDFRDKELRNSFPASPHRESSHPRDYPRKSRSWDRKNYEESSRSSKRDRREGLPEYNGYSSPRRESPHCRDYPRKNQSYEEKNYEESYRTNKRDRRESISEYAGYSSPHRESSYLRDYPHKNRSCDQSYEESRRSNKRDHNETRSGFTGYSSSVGQLQSPYHKDSSVSSVGQTHKSSKSPAYMAEDLNNFERLEFNEPKAKYNNSSHFQEFRNFGLQIQDQRPSQMEVLPSSSHDQSPRTVEKSQNLHQVLTTYKPSKWSPMMTGDSHLLSRKSNGQVPRKENGPDIQEYRNSGPQIPEQMNYMSSSSYDLAFKNPRQQSFLIPQASSVCIDEKGLQTQKASKWSSTTEHFDQHESHESSREHLVSHFQEFQNCGPQKLAQINSVAHSSHGQTSEETHKVESSSNVKGSEQASGYTGYDNTKMSADNVGTSECDLQSETNKLLQNALRLLSAASGIVSDNSSGKIQSQDVVKLMKLLLDSGIQNLQHSIVEATTSKNSEATPNSDKFALNGEKGSIKLDDQCEYDDRASAFTEKLWEGTLQLSSSVTVSAVAFFKSGEKMQDFSWSDSVAVKGKVRLEAFEKYVQDLPRSRTRGLMVMSFCCKEGSSDDWLKGMKEIARKYKDGNKVGFAQLSNGIDLYICPHSDAVITILAKHGFFKGMTAVIDKNDPLIGCVVWRKNPSSSKTTESSTLHSSVPEQNPTVANQNQEPLSYLSVTVESKGDDKPPGFEIDLEMEKSNLQPPTVVPENSGASTSSDNGDDDLPEYDFGSVVSQISEVGANASGFAAEKLGEKTGPESSIISTESPDFHFQELVSHNRRSLPIESQKEIKANPSSLQPQNKGHMPELQDSNNAYIPNSSTLFEDDDDDDDIPEWCPPVFSNSGPEVTQPAKPSFSSSHSEIPEWFPPVFSNSGPEVTQGAKPSFSSSHSEIPKWCPPIFSNSGPEVTQGTKPSFSSSHSEIPALGFTIPASSGNLPPLPPPPPPPPRNNNYPHNRGVGPSFSSSLPTSGFAPPLPPTPPPAHLQFHKETYNYAPHVPTSQCNGFMHRGPNFPPDFARNSASGPQFNPTGMENPVYRPTWRGPWP